MVPRADALRDSAPANVCSIPTLKLLLRLYGTILIGNRNHLQPTLEAKIGSWLQHGMSKGELDGARCADVTHLAGQILALVV